MQTTDVENFPGFPDAIMGPELMDSMRKQAERFGAELLSDDVTDVDLEPVKATSVKIIMTDPGADSTARISEVEIFGKKAR